jgi:hypothetical protein
MSGTVETPQDWVWQGFFGPMADAVAAKVLTDQDQRAGVWIPLPGEPPLPVDETNAVGMFAVQTRRGDPIPKPAGLRKANPRIVGRLVGG